MLRCEEELGHTVQEPGASKALAVLWVLVFNELKTMGRRGMLVFAGHIRRIWDSGGGGGARAASQVRHSSSGRNLVPRRTLPEVPGEGRVVDLLLVF